MIAHKWSVPYSDLITAVMACFIGILLLKNQDAKPVTTPVTQAQQVSTQSDTSASPTVVGNTLAYPISSDILFDIGSATLKPNPILDKVANAVIKEGAFLRIEGHTDSQPIRSAAFASNWELSAARAISVLHYLEQKGVPAKQLKAVGLADTQPVSDSPAANRRVVLVISMASA